MVKGTSIILVIIRITMLTVQSEIRSLVNILRADFDDFFGSLCNDIRNNRLNVWVICMAGSLR